MRGRCVLCDCVTLSNNINRLLKNKIKKKNTRTSSLIAVRASLCNRLSRVCGNRRVARSHVKTSAVSLG